MNTIIVHLNGSDFAIRRMDGPNLIASAPRMRNRAARLAATIPKSRFRGYSRALLAAITIVNGNGGGASDAMISVRPPFSLIFRFSFSKRDFPAIFCTPSSPSLRATRSSRNTPIVQPHTAAAT